MSLADLEGVKALPLLVAFVFIVSFCLFRLGKIFTLNDSDIHSDSDTDGLIRTFLSVDSVSRDKLCLGNKIKENFKLKVPEEIVSLSMSGLFFLAITQWNSYGSSAAMEPEFYIQNPANYSIEGELISDNRENRFSKSGKSSPQIEENTGEYPSRIYGTTSEKSNDWLDYRSSLMTRLVVRRYYQEL